VDLEIKESYITWLFDNKEYLFSLIQPLYETCIANGNERREIKDDLLLSFYKHANELICHEAGKVLAIPVDTCYNFIDQPNDLIDWILFTKENT